MATDRVHPLLRSLVRPRLVAVPAKRAICHLCGDLGRVGAEPCWRCVAKGEPVAIALARLQAEQPGRPS